VYFRFPRSQSARRKLSSPLHSCSPLFYTTTNANAIRSGRPIIRRDRLVLSVPSSRWIRTRLLLPLHSAPVISHAPPALTPRAVRSSSHADLGYLRFLPDRGTPKKRRSFVSTFPTIRLLLTQGLYMSFRSGLVFRLPRPFPTRSPI